MKVTANFARPPLPWIWPAAILWGTTVLALVIAVLAVRSTRELAAEESILQTRLERAQERLSHRVDVSLPTSGERESLRNRIREWNQLAGVAGWSTARLLAWLEQHTPQEVYFVSFQHEPREGEVLLVAQSTSRSALTTFLRTLEQEAAFGEVLLSKQSDRTGPASLAQFEIRLRLRS